MTNGEAILQIENAIIAGSLDDVSCGALKMAIEALKNQPQWISVEDRLPECEKSVIIHTKCAHGSNVITKGIYENGKIIPEKSIWIWDECYELCIYDEEIDEYYIPEGWFEWNNFSENRGIIDQEVTHWMPLPEPPKEDK